MGIQSYINSAQPYIDNVQSCINSGRQAFSLLPDKVQRGIVIGALAVGSALILPIALKALGLHGAAAVVTGVVSVITGVVSLTITLASMFLSIAAIALIAFLAFSLLKTNPHN